MYKDKAGLIMGLTRENLKFEISARAINQPLYTAFESEAWVKLASLTSRRMLKNGENAQNFPRITFITAWYSSDSVYELNFHPL